MKNLPNGSISAVCLEVIGDIPYLKPDIPQPTEKALDEVLLREHGVLIIKNKIVIAKHMHFANTSSYAVPSEDLTFNVQGRLVLVAQLIEAVSLGIRTRQLVIQLPGPGAIRTELFQG